MGKVNNLEEIFFINKRFIRENGEEVTPKEIEWEFVKMVWPKIGSIGEYIKGKIYQRFKELLGDGGKNYNKINAYWKKDHGEEMYYPLTFGVHFCKI